jgi:cell division septum initiation protein DivIVA
MTEEVIAIEILQLVDQLEAVLNRGWRVPFTSSLVVDEEECLRLIDQMRMSVPDEIRQAQRIIQQRDYILVQAEEQARQIINEAQAKSASSSSLQSALSEHEVVKAAQQRAASILAEARRRQEEMRKEADDYALNVLRELSRHLEAILTQVNNGIKALSSLSSSHGSSAGEQHSDKG